MRKVAIFGQSDAVKTQKALTTLLTILEKYSVTVFFEEHFYNIFKHQNTTGKNYATFLSFHNLDRSFDLFFSLGGDGTILRGITYIRDSNIPILGINTGRLGFLANIQKDAIEKSIELLIAKEYTIQERTLLSIETNPSVDSFSEFSFALNEITIARENTTSMIGIKTFLNKEYLTNYWSDGLIIATPTGSTGYSLSCNGPVILPDSKSFVINPIAPHNLNARPVVIPDDTSIELKVNSREKSFLISLDSRIKSVTRDTEIFIKKSTFTIKSIIPSNHSFLNTLRTKLLWGEDTRNESNL